MKPDAVETRIVGAMIRTTWIAAVAAVAGFGLAACGGSTSPSAAPTAPPATAAPMTARQVAAHLAPLGCRAAPVTDQLDFGGIKPLVSLECTVAGERIGIDQYRNGEQLAATMQLARTVGCQIAKSFGATGGDQDYVLGAATMTVAQTASTSTRIHAALPGSTISVVHCA